MFLVTIYNMETDREFKESIPNAAELDVLVESMHSTYGDILQIDIEQVEEEIKTRPYSEPPAKF